MSLIATVAIICLTVVVTIAVACLSFVLTFKALVSIGVSLETAVIVAKAVCFMVIGFFTPLSSGLAQWANSGQLPGPIIWVVTAGSCFVGMASQLLSFLSNSYSDYQKSRPPSNGLAPVVPVQPQSKP